MRGAKTPLPLIISGNRNFMSPCEWHVKELRTSQRRRGYGFRQIKAFFFPEWRIFISEIKGRIRCHHV